MIRDILIPVRSLDYIDLNDDFKSIKKKIITTYFTRIIVFSKNIIVGYLHVKDILSVISDNLTKERLLPLVRTILFCK